ncbi:MAG: hypothetical protein JSW68_14635 [Burkholderiales bacterium]|nr:MAG: hypothetical protein JSW68_14635 [Burkholderiales bacterium]
MKIWYQSASAYGYEPVWDEYGRTLEEQCRKVLHPDTELKVAGIEVMVRDVENWKALQYFQNAQVLNNMRRAEREGFDAVVVGCTLDTVVQEGRSLLNIPVVGISEASYHVAMMMGRMFAIVTSSSAFCEVYAELAERYGVAGRYLARPYIVGASEEEIALALKDPGPLAERMRAEIERAVDDGASVVIPAPGFLTTLAYRVGMTRVRDALVLDTVSVAVKMGEMLAGLRRAGVEPSRRIGSYARPDDAFADAALARLRERFRIE